MSLLVICSVVKFQLTAARRRLRGVAEGFGRDVTVSTHSRPKAAAKPEAAGRAHATFQLTAARRRLRLRRPARPRPRSFNSQPPEGGCTTYEPGQTCWYQFQLTAARRRLRFLTSVYSFWALFQLTAARRRLPAIWVVLLTPFPSFNSQPPEGGCVQARHWVLYF